jgi:PKD repeat protein
VGGDSTWAGANYFAGQIDEVAVYPSVLSADQVARHFDIGTTGQPFNQPPTASFTSTVSGLTASLNGSASTDAEGPLAGYAWDFGDGATGTGATTSHPYAAAGTYRVTLTVTDSGGKKASVSHLVGAGTAAPLTGAYAQAVQADGAKSYWRLGEPSGPGFDAIGSDDLTVGTGVTRNTAGALSGDSNGAAGFDGTDNGLAAGRTATPGPNTFSIEAWFNTTSTSGGKIVGFGNSNTGTSSNYDRHIYMDEQGIVYFGIWTGDATTVQTGPGLNDGHWHHVVASLGTAGLAMYVDGALVGRNTSASVAQPYSGYWRIGGDSSWAGAPFFAGSIDDVAIYPTALTDAQVARHHDLGVGTAPANTPPTASFTTTPTGLTVSVDGSASSDPGGSIASYAWTWGDNTAAGSGVTTSHTYGAAGTYTITLTVTDNGQLTGTTTRSVQVTAPPANSPPTAAFGVPTTNGLGVSVTSTSSDPDGTITATSWDWGDGTAAGTGTTTTHTYGAAGTYTITLTVTDNQSATGQTTRTVTVSAPQGPPAIAADAFNRTVTGGLGTADTGGAWTASAGPTRQSVTPGAAELQLTAANQNTASYLGGVSQTSADIRTALTATTAPTGSGTYVYVSGRRVNNVGEYRVRIRLLANGTVGLALSRLTGTTEAFPNGEVIVPGLTYTPGTALNVHVQVFGTGTTTVRATVWTTGTEPATWQLTRTDSTAGLQAAGGVGLAVHRPSDTTATTAVRFTSYRVTAAA